MTNFTANNSRPLAIVGAGPLTSPIWKFGDEYTGFQYRFNVFRQLRRKGTVSQLFRPSDVLQLVKLSQVLAAVLADDGCLPQQEKATLLTLASELDDLLTRLHLAGLTGNQRA